MKGQRIKFGNCVKKLFLMLCLLPSLSHAGMTGKDLKMWYDAQLRIRFTPEKEKTMDEYASAYLQGYVAAMADSLNKVSVCPSNDGDYFTFADSVGKYITQHPELESIPAPKIVYDVLTTEYPCKQ